jgi:hypothetical protein
MPPITSADFETSASGVENPNILSWSEKQMPGDLPSLVYSVMGDNCFQRFADFSRWPAGWDSGTGESVAWGTYENLAAFLTTVRFRTGRPPSLFLTNNGEFEIAWDARDGSEMTVTISPGGAHVYVDATGREEDISTDMLGELGHRLRSLTI